MPRLRTTANELAAGQRSPEFLEILARGLKVIEAFRDRKKPMTLSDVASAVDVPRATARRALITLTELGFVAVDGRLFTLTARVLSLASAYLTSTIVPTVMQPIVETVCTAVGEACSAAVLDGDDIVFVARATPPRMMSVGLEIGYRLPASGTAVGRVLLSGFSNREIDEHLARAEPQRLTERTIVSKRALKAAILSVRKDGYAAVDQEVQDGFRSIAVPVLRADGRMSCALHVGTHAVNIPLQAAISGILPTLQASARNASPMLI